MNIFLWILQVLLSIVFIMHGFVFIFLPEGAVEMINQLNLAPAFRIFIGVSEWLAVLGLILPGLTRSKLVLTPLAAAGLMIVMGSSIVFHLMRGEPVVGNIMIFVLVTFVAYMRWKVVPLKGKVET